MQKKITICSEVGNETDVDTKKKKKKNKFEGLFEKHNGGDEVIDARELRAILNDGLCQGMYNAYL